MIQERQSKIVDLVNEYGTVPFSLLTEKFPEISEMTLRKDLKSLDLEGQIVRIHGGARSLETVRGIDIPLSQRLGQNIESKKLIAQKARSLVKEDTSVFLDSGSTMTELARAFPDIPCTVFTGGLSCINELSKLSNVNVYMLGGMINKNSLSVRGAKITHELDSMYFDIAFISVNGYSTENGFSCRSPERWEMEKTVIRRSNKVVVLMDSAKNGKNCTYSICKPEEVDILVTDDNLPAITRETLEKYGVEMI